ncbi:hypothetical protein A3H09_00600 [Candidatus Falkowbacteria bacterium RIFCSPLOWO2_12_FULL_45_13]|uniref:Uncharacterized protein n=2 Tax=Candidatus Falkowiibacteriota TaxID=1752728 RepID=A0A1F5SE74_9BACT|nr:MAG: hypothetical protein A3H66_02870 [Candidatus Falkowbacteria bacterium RIFCSPLOWO2_02_FULL_45_21]OGF30780.1 MAG: hypothetical protein A3H09_00600 [Candidatus Falkowbacteria bacterium RIFCSPLOWO2_12_FULL_45_13]
MGFEFKHREPLKPKVGADVLVSENADKKAAEDLCVKLARPLLTPHFPLSAKGKEVAGKIAAGLRMDPRELPTVENPHGEYFSGLAELEPAEEKELYGAHLAVVQTTKGCRHQCTFCAADTSREVQTMPFQAVLKIGERMRRREALIEKDWIKFCHDLGAQLKIDTSFMHDDRFKADSSTGGEWDARTALAKALGLRGRGFNPQTVREINELLIKMVPSYPVLIEYFRGAKKTPEELLAFVNGPMGDYRDGNQLFVTDYVKGLGFPITTSQFFSSIMNYNDSDPFDYRDNKFLHSDGSPADYGDVVEVLASKKRRIHITTAGWYQPDSVAQGAAEKIVKKGGEFLDRVRISVSPYEVRARKNPKQYMSDMVNVCRTLQPLRPEILLHGNDDFANMFKEAIKQASPDYDKWFIKRQPKISYFSGRAKNMEHDENKKEQDIMACSPGHYLLPDGTVSFLRQSKTMNEGGQYVTPGDRPVPTGKKLW